MKTNRKIGLAVLAGVCMGVAGARVTHAQQAKTPPPAYVMAEIEVTDLAAIQQYGAKVPETLAPFAGHYHYVIRTGSAQSLEGEPPKGIVVIAFDNAEMAHAWYDSPAYAAIRPIRQRASKSRIFIAEGLAP